MAMEAKAMVRQARISPLKVRQMLTLINHKKADEALLILKFSPQKAARIVYKVLHSAMANAEHNLGMDMDKLVVVNAAADNGPVMKRFNAVSKGSAHPYKHRTTHVTVVVAER
jgi:large subunit ribosomal protein L22